MEEVHDFGTIQLERAYKLATRHALTVAAVVASAGLAAAATVQWAHNRAVDRAWAARWTVDGPPPTITPEWYDKLGVRQATPVSFGAARGDFAFGATDCTLIDYDHGSPTKPFTVCQFSSPFVVRLHVGGRQVMFEPGVGRPATVSYAHGDVRCVVAANFIEW
jgi:hypothetical protein